MSKKMLMLVLAAVSAAAAVLPAAAVAIVPLHSIGPVPETGSTTGGAGKLSTPSGLTVSCNEFKGSGTATTTTQGTGRLTFSNCKESLFGSSCTSTGEVSGSITTEVLSSELATLQRTGETKVPGVLVKPPMTGVYAAFVCGGGLVNVTITGNGVLGRITAPACGASGKTGTVAFEATAHGVQKYKTLEGTSTEYSLAKGSETAAIEGTGTGTTINERKFECT
jgi:hypothetical protein